LKETLGGLKGKSVGSTISKVNVPPLYGDSDCRKVDESIDKIVELS
jgi:hypothetical protein